MGRLDVIRVSILVVTLAAAVLPGRAGADPHPFECRALETAGLPPADAATAVDIVCRELATVAGSAGQYSVSLRPLGSALVVTVSHAGRAEGRSLVLDGFEEIPIAARRLAEAVVRGRAIEGTQRVDNLVESEGRTLVSRPGGRKFEMGALGLLAGQGTPAGAGFNLGFAYEAPSFAIPAQIRFARSSEEDRSVSTFAIATGARHFFSGRAASPFVGGGLSMLYLAYTEFSEVEFAAGRTTGFGFRALEDSRWGPGLYVEAGAQLFRLHRGRLTAGVRADFPLYSLHPAGFEFGPQREIVADGGRRYIVPITFGLSLSF